MSAADVIDNVLLDLPSPGAFVNGAITVTVVHALLRKLDGGDLRSIGCSDAVAREVIANPSLAGELVTGLGSANPVIRMRSADALEKVCRKLPSAVQPHRSRLLRLLMKPQPREVLWHLLQIAPRIAWNREELSAVYAAATRALSESSSIARVCAMQALADLLPGFPERGPEVARRIREIIGSGTPAMQARGRKLLRAIRGARLSVEPTSSTPRSTPRTQATGGSRTGGGGTRKGSRAASTQGKAGSC